jgi:hypothetical protein
MKKIECIHTCICFKERYCTLLYLASDYNQLKAKIEQKNAVQRKILGQMRQSTRKDGGEKD